MGYFVGATNLTNLAPASIGSIPLTNGAWLVIGNAFFPTTTYAQLSISITAAVDGASVIQNVNGGLFIVRYVIVSSGPTTWYLYANCSPSVTIQNPAFYAVRLG